MKEKFVQTIYYFVDLAQDKAFCSRQNLHHNLELYDLMKKIVKNSFVFHHRANLEDHILQY